MTVTDPVPGHGVTLLENLVSASHARIVDLLAEASRDVPTVGVADAVQRRLVHDVRAHLAVVRQVLGADLTHPQREEVDRDHGELVSALDQLDAGSVDRAVGLQDLLVCVRSHIASEEASLLPSLRRRVGDRRMAALSFNYASIADTHLD
jgi:hypothetical protein